MKLNGNYFDLFGLPASHRIDPAALEKAYELGSMENHPDFFATAPPEERERAGRITAQLNEGYRVLASEPLRADYLLGLLAGGVELKSDSLPSGFLQEMFGLQEELEELTENQAGPESGQLRSQLEERIAGAAAERERLFARADGNGERELFQALRTNLNCDKYLRRLLERLD